MKSFCGYFNNGLCKSCDLIALDYRDQILEKENVLRRELSPLAVPELSATVTSSPRNFRNKAKFIVTGTADEPIIGLAGEEDLDQGRELLHCELHAKEINDALPALKEFITVAKLSPYQIATKKGELKGIILFYSPSTKESYLRFIMRSKESITRIVKHAALLSKFSSVSVNIQPVAHAILEGEEEIFITEARSIRHDYGTVKGLLGPRAFVQTNQNISEKLYATAASWVAELQTDIFLELFCGQGAFSFHCAPFIARGYGIEINAEAVAVANETAKASGLNHLEFFSADAAQVSSKIESVAPTVILVNPPRRGLGTVTDLLAKHSPLHVIYSSCNHETLAKDLKLLDPVYEIKKIQIFDMFPHTKHFETLVLLQKRPI